MPTRDSQEPGARRRSTGASPQLYQYAGLGMQFALTILAFAALGYWLDSRLGTRPWLLIVGVFAGFAGGLLSLIRRVPPAHPRVPPRSGGEQRRGRPSEAQRPPPQRPPTPERPSDPDSPHAK